MGDNFCDMLFVFLHTQLLLKGVCSDSKDSCIVKLDS